MSKRFIYIPKERPSTLLRICSMLFTAGTVVLWLVGDSFGIASGDLLIMSGIAVLLLTLSLNGMRAEKEARKSSEELQKIREETGKGDYNNDIFYE